jgi:isoprenylcysteine carboxyl methyltransferase (ICMT) family protein YpbQ
MHSRSTRRIITLESAPLVRSGPYRFVRHPNYLVVAGEIATLPLAFGEVEVAIVFTVLNAAMLAWRIRQEDTALAARPPSQGVSITPRKPRRVDHSTHASKGRE